MSFRTSAPALKSPPLDLELRGAGNILSGEQHGHIASVGFDTYLRLLDETVRELKGEEAPLEVSSTLNLGLDIRIPSEYIGDEQQRLRAYKKVADVHDDEQADTTRAELTDRYGPLPEAVETLIRFAQLKSTAQKLAIEAVDRRGAWLNIKFHPGSRIEPAKLMELVHTKAGAQFTAGGSVADSPHGRSRSRESTAWPGARAASRRVRGLGSLKFAGALCAGKLRTR
ncbi:MAG: TRCF domain-containing protein [Acidobacteriota bacterium]